MAIEFVFDLLLRATLLLVNVCTSPLRIFPFERPDSRIPDNISPTMLLEFEG